MEFKKNIALIGIGNCGNQVAYLGEKKYPELFDSIYINTSESDLSQVNPASDKLKYKIGEDEYVEGSGKNRMKSKKYLRGDIERIVKDETFNATIIDKDYVYVIVSSSGGTGSGAGPVMTNILKRSFPDSHIIMVGVLPNLANSSMLELCNTMEFLDELYTKMPGQPHMLYDNDTVADLPITVGLTTVNDSVIEDLRVLSMVDNHPTPYDSIDGADLETIVTTPGRTMVIRLVDEINEKSVEDGQLGAMMVKAIKSSNQAEIDRVKKVAKLGLITYFTESVNNIYSPSLPELEAFIGTPKLRFNHNAINNGSDKLNFIHLIASGLPAINDRIYKYKERIEELKAEVQDGSDSGYALKGDDFVKNIIGDIRQEIDEDNGDETVKIDDIFNDFM